jgi:hypothetical protein
MKPEEVAKINFAGFIFLYVQVDGSKILLQG